MIIKRLSEGLWFVGEIVDLEQEAGNWDIFEGVETRYVLVWVLVMADTEEEAEEKYDQRYDEDRHIVWLV
jgi:hypothetical protein